LGANFPRGGLRSQTSRKTETRKVEIDKRHEKIAAGADQKPNSYLFNFRGLRVSKLAQK